MLHIASLVAYIMVHDKDMEICSVVQTFQDWKLPLK